MPSIREHTWIRLGGILDLLQQHQRLGQLALDQDGGHRRDDAAVDEEVELCEWAGVALGHGGPGRGGGEGGGTSLCFGTPGVQ